MMDFRIISAKVQLKLLSVSPLRGFNPPSVVVTGTNLNLTEEVTYNGVTADEFIVHSPSRLIVKIPKSQVGRALSDLKAYSSISLAKMDARVTFGINRPLKTVQGIDRLVQSWLMVFMTTPGSSIFAPTSGGGGRALIGRSTDRMNKSVAADLALAIESTKTELLNLQAGRSLPLDERLLSSDLEAIAFDEKTQALNATVSLRNMAGDSASISVG